MMNFWATRYDNEAFTFWWNSKITREENMNYVWMMEAR